MEPEVQNFMEPEVHNFTEPEVQNFMEPEVSNLNEPEVHSFMEPEIDEAEFCDTLKESEVTTQREDGTLCVKIEALIENFSKRKIIGQITGTINLRSTNSLIRTPIPFAMSLQ